MARPAPLWFWYIMGQFIRCSSPKFRQHTESQPDYPNAGLLNMTNAHKDQLRSLKGVVNSKLNSTLRTRRPMQFTNDAMIIPSTPQSECSTLVDFPVDYATDDLQYGDPQSDDTDTYLLDAHNSAWSRPRKNQAPSRAVSSHPTKHQQHHGSAQMLDADDRAWGSARHAQTSLPTRILHALAGQ
ncbi:hypothetical protein BDW22DRAFT_30136 [Trametopsis cervina]|nr:hypothetical protein BDW22DRAFT_30136 [Trametopsis cervina]